MQGVDLDSKLGRDEACPSEMRLDRLHWGELAPGEAETVNGHLEVCAACRQRMELRRQGFEAFEEVDPVAMRVRIQDAVTRDPPARRRTSPAARVTWFGWLAAAVTAVLLFVLVLVPDWGRDQAGEGDAVRVKGGVKMALFRERAGKVEQVISGDRFLAGDRLRFSVDLSSDGQILIVGVEQSGMLYPCYPMDASRASRAARAGTDVELPGAIRLDASAGDEWIHLVWCPHVFTIDDLRPGEMTGVLVLPSGCTSTGFKMRKVEE